MRDLALYLALSLVLIAGGTLVATVVVGPWMAPYALTAGASSLFGSLGSVLWLQRQKRRQDAQDTPK